MKRLVYIATRLSDFDESLVDVVKGDVVGHSGNLDGIYEEGLNITAIMTEKPLEEITHLDFFRSSGSDFRDPKSGGFDTKGKDITYDFLFEAYDNKYYPSKCPNLGVDFSFKIGDELIADVPLTIGNKGYNKGYGKYFIYEIKE